jgi:hypothetical protein
MAVTVAIKPVSIQVAIRPCVLGTTVIVSIKEETNVRVRIKPCPIST